MGELVRDHIREVARLRAEITTAKRGALWGDFRTYQNRWDDDRAGRCADAYGLTLAHIKAERTWWLLNGQPARPERIAEPGTLRGEEPPAAEVAAAVDQPEPVRIDETSPPNPPLAVEETGARRGRKPVFDWPSNVDLLQEEARRRAEIPKGWAKTWADEWGVKVHTLQGRLSDARKSAAAEEPVLGGGTTTAAASTMAEPAAVPTLGSENGPPDHTDEEDQEIHSLDLEGGLMSTEQVVLETEPGAQAVVPPTEEVQRMQVNTSVYPWPENSVLLTMAQEYKAKHGNLGWQRELAKDLQVPKGALSHKLQRLARKKSPTGEGGLIHVATPMTTPPAVMQDAEVIVPVEVWQGKDLVDVIQHLERMLGGPVNFVMEKDHSRFFRTLGA